MLKKIEGSAVRGVIRSVRSNDKSKDIRRGGVRLDKQKISGGGGGGGDTRRSKGFSIRDKSDWLEDGYKVERGRKRDRPALKTRNKLDGRQKKRVGDTWEP